MTMLRKIIVLSVDYDPSQHDDPASWDWSALIDQPGTVLVAAGYVGEINDDDTITDESGERLHLTTPHES